MLSPQRLTFFALLPATLLWIAALPMPLTAAGEAAAEPTPGTLQPVTDAPSESRPAKTHSSFDELKPTRITPAPKAKATPAPKAAPTPDESSKSKMIELSPFAAPSSTPGVSKPTPAPTPAFTPAVPPAAKTPSTTTTKAPRDATTKAPHDATTKAPHDATATPSPAPTPAPSPADNPVAASASKQLDLNLATEEQLAVLPGLDAVRAKLIAAHRKAIGGFKRLDELRHVFGISEEAYLKIAPRLKLDAPCPPTPVPASASRLTSGTPLLPEVK